jgi:hypothetical protein
MRYTMSKATKRRVEARTLFDRSVSLFDRSVLVIEPAPAETDEDRLSRCHRQAEILGFVIGHFYDHEDREDYVGANGGDFIVIHRESGVMFGVNELRSESGLLTLAEVDEWFANLVIFETTGSLPQRFIADGVLHYGKLRPDGFVRGLCRSLFRARLCSFEFLSARAAAYYECCAGCAEFPGNANRMLDEAAKSEKP